ncbi:MAG TPA: hypothetical protein VJT78_06485 [Candidatus Dormibacteraeota bacterium]|nr:hypothetical protein [Candidatus Dormibacteraeota bacterium]
MAAVLRLARERAWLPLLPALVSWSLLFGYQWAFYFAYRGQQPTVFNYYSGVLGDGFLIPAVNVAGFIMLRQLSYAIPWRRLPVYVLLGFATALSAFLIQAHLDWVNWSMPIPFQWSDVGQFHFFVMWAEMAYLYLVFATAINNWRALWSDANAWRSFTAGWVAIALFGATLAADYIH